MVTTPATSARASDLAEEREPADEADLAGVLVAGCSQVLGVVGGDGLVPEVRLLD